MPGHERSPGCDEDPREELVVLEPQRLHRGDERFEGERDGVAEDEEQDREQRPSAAARPESRGRRPNDAAERGMRETERGQARERDRIRAEPHHAVEQLDAGFHRAGKAAAGGSVETDERRPEPERHQDSTGDPTAGTRTKSADATNASPA